MSENNISTDQVKSWKKQFKQELKKGVIPALERMQTISVNVAELLTLPDNNTDNLKYQFTSLEKFCRVARNNLNDYLEDFDAQLEKFLDYLAEAEGDTTKKAKKDLDQFDELAKAIRNIGKGN